MAKTHGLWKNNQKVYIAWQNIKKRCFNPANKHYKTYGGVGISLEARFVNDFSAFLSEVGQPPENSRKWSIDRIDLDKGYISGNMQWTTQDKQTRNTRKYCTNSSGKSGVYWSLNSSGNTRAVAHWIDLKGQARTKIFLVKKYGLLPTFKMAFEYRDKMINDLNSQGAGYTEKHGK